MTNRYAIIIAGGRGERFWPQSRLKKPKHLLPIVGDKPILNQTLERLKGFPPSHIFVITNKEQKGPIETLLKNIPKENIIAEPMGKDTLPAIGLAMLLVKNKDPHASFCILPADHYIKNHQAFRETLNAGFQLAQATPHIITLGIQPTSPSTAYGYIKRGTAFETLQTTLPVYTVDAFKEKPDLQTARQYLDSHSYYWNAGCFVFSVATLEAALSQYTPKTKSVLDALFTQMKQKHPLEPLLETYYPKLEKISIDYAIMEQASNIIVLEASFDWDDVGSWNALARHHPKDDKGNVVLGKALTLESSNNIIVNDKGHLTALIGVNDLIIVHTPEATLICPKSKSQDIKQIVQEIAKDPDLKPLI